MSNTTPTPDHDDQHKTPDAASVEAWLKAPVTLTVKRWMLLAGGFVVLVLFLLALD